MTVNQIIQYLRLSVHVQDPDNPGEVDKAYLSMTDEDLLLYLNVVMTRDFADIPSLDQLPAMDVYPLTLLAKKELYYALAVIEAPKYDLGADNNNYLKRSQRFSHYMELAKQADSEYQDYLDNGGGFEADDGTTLAPNTLSSFDVLLPNRYFTKRYYEKGSVPSPVLSVDDFTDTKVLLRWKNRCRHYAWTNIYISDSEILDEYQEGRDKILDRSTLVKQFTDIRQVTMEITGLLPSTTYYVVMELVTTSGLVGYAQAIFATDEPNEEEPLEG